MGRFRLRGAGCAVLRGVAALEEEALPLLSAVGDVVGVEVAVGVVAALDAARVLVEHVEEEDVDDVEAVRVDDKLDLGTVKPVRELILTATFEFDVF